MLNRTLVERVYESIKRYNISEYNPSVPMSDQFIKDFLSAEGYNESEAKHAIMILNEAHKVFIIAITKENKQTGSKKIDGYIVAELSVVSNLRSIYQKRLTEAYNKEKGTRYGPQQVLRDIMNRMNILVNTPVGRIANITIMLNEYENLMIKNSEEFTETWCEDKLDEYIEHVSFEDEKESDESQPPPPPEETAKSGNARAVDTSEYENYSKDDRILPPQKMMMIYGAEFFFRVKLRKYEFCVLRDLIREGHIKRRVDIILLRNMIKTIKGNFDRDPKLNDYFEDIYHLDRELSKKIYFSAK